VTAASHAGRTVEVSGATLTVAAGLAAAGGLLAARAGAFGVVAVAAVVLIVVVAAYPPVAAYVLIATTPFIVGLNRGTVLPFLRPNEAVLLVLAAGLGLRGAASVLTGRPADLRLGRVEASIVALATTGSVLPLLWMAARGMHIGREDILYATALWKYLMLFFVVRSSVRSQRDVARCLALSMAVAAIVALIGILQSLKLFGVPHLLASHYVHDTDMPESLEIHRSTATFASALAMADVMVFNLAIAAAWLVKQGGPRRLLAAAMVLFALGCFAAGEVSGVVGLAAGVIALGILTGHLRRAVRALLLFLLCAGLLLSPVVKARLAQIDPATGQPVSWLGRRNNLERYILPQFSAVSNVVLGVRTQARVRAPETLADRWIYIESGHLWLLWTGGLPMLVAFFVFVGSAMGATGALARARSDPVGVAAMASFGAVVVMATGTIFDPHLTFRGTADLNFTLLALALADRRCPARPDGDRPERTATVPLPAAAERSAMAIAALPPGGQDG
jgi:hypothetical protein